MQQYLLQRAKLVETALSEYLPTLPKAAKHLEAAMKYSVMAGGKRMRSVLMLASAEAVGSRYEHLVPIACAIEFVHTYSLIHDDLPAMDDDAWRRGKPTNHMVFGEGQAILAGDALLTEAFLLLSDRAILSQVGSDTMLAVINEIATAAGAHGMVGGQSVDIGSEGMLIGPNTCTVLEYIHAHKTGALIRAAIRIGAILGGATATQLSSLTQYGEYVGLAFQISDDILNATGDAETLGKPVNTDSDRKKLTYVAVHGLSQATIRAENLIERALSTIRGFDEKAEPLRDLAAYIIKRNN